MASHARTMSGVMGASHSCLSSLAHSAPGFVNAAEKRPSALGARAIRASRDVGQSPPPSSSLLLVLWSFCRAGFDNDPSAGSPTETLLRLLLPLNDKVQWTSRDVAGSEPPTSPRSEHFTGPFNR